jgi:hypothetical protein
MKPHHMGLLLRSTCPTPLRRNAISSLAILKPSPECVSNSKEESLALSLKCKRLLSQPFRVKLRKGARIRCFEAAADAISLLPSRHHTSNSKPHNINMRPRTPQRRAALALLKALHALPKGRDEFNSNAISSSDPSQERPRLRWILRAAKQTGASSESRSRWGCLRAAECSEFMNICGFDKEMMCTTREALRLRRRKQSQL